MTLYLKYRPQRIAELDLTEVREHLTKILSATNFPHAWLFTGPRGTGKTSSARILAKAINCENKKGIEPCNECEICTAITSGNAPDVVEIDAASNRGIDEIRELRERVALAPLQATYKVYIIDEVHMLTNEAANALLKTLEEPPVNVVFILCTTEVERLPETVVSRCTRIQFKMPQVSETVNKLERVAKSENIKLKNEDLVEIAKAARGSFRDAIKILEQAAVGGDIQKILGMASGLAPEDFWKMVESGKRNEALTFIKSMEEAGGNARSFIERCVELAREKLVAEAQGKRKTDFIIRLIEGLQEAYERAKSSAVAWLPLEIFVIKFTEESTGLAVERKPQPEKESGSGKDEEKSKVEDLKNVDTAEPMKATVQVMAGKYKLEDLAQKWLDILKLVKPKNHSVEALLRSTKPIEFDGRSLTLEVFYKFHMDKLATEKCREIVETSVVEVLELESPVRLNLKLGARKPTGSDMGTPVAKPTEELDGAVEEDIIRAAQEIFKVEAI